jgi:hypothetical protein
VRINAGKSRSTCPEKSATSSAGLKPIAASSFAASSFRPVTTDRRDAALLRQVIDDDNASRRLQVFREALEVGRRVVDVVQDVVKQRDVDGSGSFGSVASPAIVWTFVTPAAFAFCWMCGKKLRSISTASTLPLAPTALDNGTTNSRTRRRDRQRGPRGAASSRRRPPVF